MLTNKEIMERIEELKGMRWELECAYDMFDETARKRRNEIHHELIKLYNEKNARGI